MQWTGDNKSKSLINIPELDMGTNGKRQKKTTEAPAGSVTDKTASGVI